jgi:hypothetical protein
VTASKGLSIIALYIVTTLYLPTSLGLPRVSAGPFVHSLTIEGTVKNMGIPDTGFKVTVSGDKPFQVFKEADFVIEDPPFAPRKVEVRSLIKVNRGGADEATGLTPANGLGDKDKNVQIRWNNGIPREASVFYSVLVGGTSGARLTATTTIDIFGN